MSGFYTGGTGGGGGGGGGGGAPGAVAWAAGNHSGASPDFAGFSEVTVTAAGDVTIQSIAAPASGAGTLRLYFPAAHNVTVKNLLAGQTLGTRIITLIGGDVGPMLGPCSVTFRYDPPSDTSGAWIEVEA
jgi:hypothetical protein